MIEQSDKLYFRKGTISNGTLKSPHSSKAGTCNCKIRTEAQKNSIASLSSSDAETRNYFGKCCEDHQINMKFSELTPRNPSMETSEGVQRFIKQVSDFIEKKNLFKEKESQRTQPERTLKKNIVKDASDNLDKSKLDKKNSSRSSGRDLEKNLQIQSPKTGGSKKRDKGVKTNPKPSLSDNKKADELKLLSRRSHPECDNEPLRGQTPRSRERVGSTTATRQSQIRRRRPSEIPLRKKRTDATRLPKPVSMLLQKPLKEVESAISLDFYTKNKSFSPIEELSLCSEIQITINASESCGKLSLPGKDSEPSPTNRTSTSDNDVNKNIKLDRCCKNPNIPVDSIMSSNESAEEKSLTEKKTKVLDLERVKTSSFTVLRTNSTALTRLESLHKQNVFSKENSSAIISSKSRIVIPKQSFSALNAKGSKKNLFSRLSSKGNKPGLKAKLKKNKKESDENLYLPMNCPQARNRTLPDPCMKTTRTRTVGSLIPGSRKTEKFTNEESKSLKVNPKKNKEINSCVKSLKRGSKSPAKDEEEFKAPPSGKSGNRKLDSQESYKSEKTKFIKKAFPFKKRSLCCVHRENVVENTNGLKSEKAVPVTPPPTPVTSQSFSAASDFEWRQVVENESSSKTVIFDKKFDHENSSWCSSESEMKKSSKTTKSTVEGRKRGMKDREKITKSKGSGLAVLGTPLNSWKDEPPEKPITAESRSGKIKVKIDLISQENEIEGNSTRDLNNANPHSFNWLFMNGVKYNESTVQHSTDPNDSKTGSGRKEVSIGNHESSIDSYSEEVTEEQTKNSQFHSGIPRPPKSCSSFKLRSQYDTSAVNIKSGKKKKMRSDAGDRRFPCANVFFKSDFSLQSKVKFDTKVRSGLTSTCNRVEQKDTLEDAPAVKLRRRNSEPHSFREFIWKRTDFATPRGHKPSVSSMASSLRHLNTDDIDDFIFWEPVPQKMTSCWETSLYHFKKPWTVLSCSVFKDNRQSSTPGLILENLRNGGSLNTRGSTASPKDRGNFHKENPFDVEPSIAQKNIDIRNWLAALNFPTLPSTSNDIISEGNFYTHSSTDADKLNTNQVSQKRRKVLPGLKFSEETSEDAGEYKKEREKYKTSTSWSVNEAVGLMELVRRKSGGFVTKEPFSESAHPNPPPNTKFSSCASSKSAEEKTVLKETNDRNTASESKIIKISEASRRPPTRETVGIASPPLGDPRLETRADGEEESRERKKEENQSWLRKSLKGNLSLQPSDINIWKYLFIFTLIIIIIFHYCFFTDFMCRN